MSENPEYECREKNPAPNHHQLDGVDNAIFLNGGVPVASWGMSESLCSTLRLVPATLASRSGDMDADLE